ncbi:nitroreductase family deazaflavin-dependent oxidoreductase [Gordonia jinghuaiqii]|uniref:Nitroreductase family deazaflavin-dependent oxidoreductase n=1 Tax=Gordonia jinghuaiqii TaxID=2758710 RepID=A0A7D7LU27_9ACTN|nr:nitroreductase/quinone reductase family protein [Gordonia jinghuaiqii]MCR5976230.1 nitroreductase family deazaflavin-dependent oxidoreductase [Gordonia jinghuaiqii]QMT03463.1 nitroreductase family deazaflavin-dependent oxidoreductase [Gordonia jinghuaiqii]
MSFESPAGTRGGRVPKGPFVRFVNKIVAPMVRRKGQFGGMNALVLTTVGRKSGQERVSPLAWFPGPDGSWLIVASANGASNNPGWYHNLKANPDKARIEVDGKTVEVRAQQLQGDERAQAWTQISKNERFAAYQEKTDRELPIIKLTAR